MNMVGSRMLSLVTLSEGTMNFFTNQRAKMYITLNKPISSCLYCVVLLVLFFGGDGLIGV